MALKDSVTVRLSSEFLKQITNHDAPAAVARNEARLDAAVADVLGIFLVEVGIAYDDTDAAHVPVGVDGVLSVLHSYSAITGRNATELRQRFERGLIRLATTRGSERRLLPSTSSKGTVSEQRDDRLVDFDRNRWDGFVPRMPQDGSGTGERFVGE